MMATSTLTGVSLEYDRKRVRAAAGMMAGFDHVMDVKFDAWNEHPHWPEINDKRKAYNLTWPHNIWLSVA
jgi:hypothetical protein